jgi:hypothetical protein
MWVKLIDSSALVLLRFLGDGILPYIELLTPALVEECRICPRKELKLVIGSPTRSRTQPDFSQLSTVFQLCIPYMISIKQHDHCRWECRIRASVFA